LALRRIEDLSDRDLSEIERVYAMGYSVRDTARRMELSEKVVSRHLRMRGLTRSTREMCGQNKRHPWNISRRGAYLASQLKLREAETS